LLLTALDSLHKANFEIDYDISSLLVFFLLGTTLTKNIVDVLPEVFESTVRLEAATKSAFEGVKDYIKLLLLNPPPIPEDV
jgi:hypothetical protein